MKLNKIKKGLEKYIQNIISTDNFIALINAPKLHSKIEIEFLCKYENYTNGQNYDILFDAILNKLISYTINHSKIIKKIKTDDANNEIEKMKLENHYIYTNKTITSRKNNVFYLNNEDDNIYICTYPLFDLNKINLTFEEKNKKDFILKINILSYPIIDYKLINNV